MSEALQSTATHTGPEERIPAMSLMPPLEISNDGHEVFEWAAKLSEHTQRLHRRRELWAAIVEGESICGSCAKWMKSSCPRERQDNRLGHKVGPSCKAPKCPEFAMDGLTAAHMAELREEHATITAMLSTCKSTPAPNGEQM